MKTIEETAAELFSVWSGRTTSVSSWDAEFEQHKERWLRLAKVGQQRALAYHKAGMTEAAEIAVARMSLMTIPDEFSDSVKQAITAAAEKKEGV